MHWFSEKLWLGLALCQVAFAVFQVPLALCQLGLAVCPLGLAVCQVGAALACVCRFMIKITCAVLVVVL